MIFPLQSFFTFTFTLAFFLVSISCNAQIKRKTVERFSNLPVPFVHIIINNGEKELISDIDGNFEIPDADSIKSITFKAYQYKTVTLDVDSVKINQEIKLSRYLLFEFDFSSSDNTVGIIKNTLEHKEENSISSLKYVSYSTYNKATLTSEKVDKANNALRKILRFLSLKFNNFKENQHFFILESVTNKKIYNKFHQKEIITGARSTIIDVPTLFIQTTQVQAFSPYDDYLNISGKTYIGPLASNSLSRYVFKIIDTLHINNSNPVYVIKYNPIPDKAVEGIKGLLLINSGDYAIQYFTASPAISKKIAMEAYQSFKYYPDHKVWFPQRTKTVVTAEKAATIFTATLDSYITEVDLNAYSPKKEFDDVELLYPEYANEQDEDFWQKHRVTPLTSRDSNTYIYYDSVDQKKYIQRGLQTGENLYYGFITYRSINIDLKRILDANHLEGARIGFGVHTNQKFSDKWILGGYWGYGFKDQKGKIGADVSYKIRNFPLLFNSAFSYDVQEAGGTFFPFNSYQYSSEPLRRTGLRIMDYVTLWENSALMHPIRYLDTKISLGISQHLPSYTYQYKDRTSQYFDFTELKLGFKYAYREKFIQLQDRKITSKAGYPAFYFLYTRGYNNFLGGKFNYQKYEMKIQHLFKLLDWGTTGIELAGGIANGDLPYMKLFNGNGSYRNFSVVIHNSFETMRYNEFLSDRYIALFMSHNFGRFYYKSRYIQPSLLLIHNVGYGSLKHPEYHNLINFKTMEKGYIESGMLLDNLLVLGLNGLKVGFGPGFFLRYGAYASPQFKNNFVIKLAVKFSL